MPNCHLHSMCKLVAAVALAACSKVSAPNLESNFKTVTITEHKVTKKSGEPYNGTLIARDAEIKEVAQSFDATGVLDEAGRLDANGLVLVMKVKDGTPDGPATLHVDLRSPRLAAEVREVIGPDLLAVAKAVAPTIKVGEATFVGGKLEGTAVAYAPTADGKGTTKVGELQLRANLPHGEAVEYYPGTSQPKRRYRFEAGTQQGLQEWFHDNGKPSRTATYVDGKPHGEVIELYANGAKRARGTYDHGRPTGTHQAWFPSGKLESEHVIEGDAVTSRSWYSTGQPTTEPPDGVVETFHASGAVRTRTTYAAGTKHGAHEVFYGNGKPREQATYKHGQLDGAFKRFYANGRPWEEATYVAGQLDGPYKKWWKNGKPAHDYAYKAGRLDGDYRTYYDTGAKWAVAKYADGKPQGTIERFFPSGKLGYVMHHENGRPHGPYQRWWPNGRPRLEATHERGALHGEFKNWLEDGSVYELATYERGRKIKSSR